MVNQIIMPKLGQTVEEALIEKWHKGEGETVEKGEILFDITTDKATLEVESFFEGTLLKVLHAEGATVPVNTVIAFLGDPGDPIPEVSPPPAAKATAAVEESLAARTQPAVAATATPGAHAATATLPSDAAFTSGRTFISPRAKRRAGELKVPFRCLNGSGPNGRIIEQDVTEYAGKRDQLNISPLAINVAFQRGVDVLNLEGAGGKITKEDIEKAEPIPEPGALRRIPLSTMRRIIAERMTESKSSIPHFYLEMDVDMSLAILLRKELNESGKPKISFNDMVMRACALAFREVPDMNVTWGGDALIYRDQADIGLAVAVDEGLMVPVLRNLNQKSLRAIAADSGKMIQKARSKHLTPDDYGNASMTISNLGMFDVHRVFPIINPGESCILGIGRIAEQVVALSGGIHIRSMMNLVLAADHRVVDGAIGAQFLRAIRDALEMPSGL